ncbi:MAG TPA: hypothetical protein VM054_00615 [bacterium]|nr:hypothetical protein [bacterium]
MGVKFIDDMLIIDEIDFIGRYQVSVDKQYLVATMDGFNSDKISIGGARDFGNGRILLAHNGKILFIKEIERPNDANVSNNGIVIVHDWLFGYTKREGVVYILDSGGNIIIEFKTACNLLESYISSDGKYALSITAGGDSYDTSKAILFNVDMRKVEWMKPTISYIADDLCKDKVRLYSRRGSVTVCIDKIEVINVFKWELDFPVLYNPWVLKKFFKNEKVTPTLESVGIFEEKLLQNIKYVKVDEKGTAIFYKLLGDCFEYLNAEKAIQYYEKAVSLNNKIGVKKKINELRNSLNNA